MSKIFEMVDIEALEKLADIVNEKELSEITLSDGDSSITVKGKKAPPPPPHGEPRREFPYPPDMAAPVSTPQPMTAPISETPSEKVHGTPVKAPIVGTFYSKPNPDASPFVTIGSQVKKGDVLYILETMKVMNEITAECDGIIGKILVKDGDPLEFDQTVMIIE